MKSDRWGFFVLLKNSSTILHLLHELTPVCFWSKARVVEQSDGEPAADRSH